jgi:thioredoxin 1
MDNQSQNREPANSAAPVCCAGTSPRWLLLSCLVLAVLAGIAWLIKPGGPPPAAPASATLPPAATPAAKTVVPPSTAARLPRLVDLGATTCIPCKEMEPILESMRAGYAGRLTVDFINVRTEAEKAKPYSIKLIPTQIWFDADGKELSRHEGVIQAADIVARFKEHGIDLGAPAASPGLPETGKSAPALPDGTVCK